MPDQGRKLLLLGGKGMLARKVMSSAPDYYSVIPVDLPEFDITDHDRVFSLVETLQPEVIVNCAAYTNVDGCETEQERANRVNGLAVGYLADAAKKVDATLVHISTDYVFDGKKNTGYVEEDTPNPQSAYGISKLLGEQALLASGLKKYFIIRSSWLYGPGGNNFVETIIRLAKERAEIGIVADQVGTPTYTGDLAVALYKLLALKDSSQPKNSMPYGIYHFSNDGQCSWYEFAEEIIAVARKNGEPMKVKKIRPIKTEEYPLPATRPNYSVFSKEKYRARTGVVEPDWRSSLEHYLQERIL